VHGCFVSEHEIKKVVDHLKAQGTPVYDENILKPRDEEGEERAKGTTCPTSCTIRPSPSSRKCGR